MLTVLRYVERNALPAQLVKRAEDWPWSSLRRWRQPDLWPFLDPGPVRRPPDWVERVNAMQTEAELRHVRECVNRGRPFGVDTWVRETAERLGLEATLRPRGRPPKSTWESTTLF